MTSTPTAPRPLHRFASRLDADHLSDGQLLARFVGERDEVAFAVLVRRHGGLVYGVCRRSLPDPADADDAFQAVFLVLLRKADSLTDRRTVGDWLHATAVRVTLKARTAFARRKRREAVVANRRPEAALPDSADPLDWFDRELAALPAQYREPVVLCLIQERSRADAAESLGIPEGTLASRLAYAKKWLADRLTKRGLAMPAALAAVVSGALLDRTAALASGAAGSGVVSQLATGAMRTMLWTKLRIGLLATAGLVVVTAGVLLAGPADRNTKRNAPVPEKKEPPEPEWMKAFRKAYELKDGEYVKRVAPPYLPERVSFKLHGLYRGHAVDPEIDADNRKRASENAMFSTLFVEQDGKKLKYRMSISSVYLKDNPTLRQGDNLLTVWEAVGHVTGLSEPEVVIDPNSKNDVLFAGKNKTVHGDFVTRKGAPLEKLAPQLEKILRDECNVDVRLTVKEEEQEVFVVGGKFKLTPPEWRGHAKKELDVYATEDGLNQEYQFAKFDVGREKAKFVETLSYSGGPVELVRFLGHRVTTRMVWDVELPAEPMMQWHNHKFKNPTKEQEAEDKDPDKVLPNVTAQTGLTFKKEKRKVPVLVVGVPEGK
jgi:RNA polymerase sigma factor (sigma-70 family)